MPRINTRRLWDEIHHTASWGALPNSYGMERLALSDDDKSVRDYFCFEAQKIGCRVITDEMGNIFSVLPGENNSIAPIGLGSHLDTQPAGESKFDIRTHGDLYQQNRWQIRRHFRSFGGSRSPQDPERTWHQDICASSSNQLDK